MELKYVLFSLFGLPVTLYALCVMLALAAGLLMMYREQKKYRLRQDTTEIFALLALPLGVIFARLVYCLCRMDIYSEMGIGGVLRIWEGGYSLMGAALGAVLAAALTARITRQSLLTLLDTFAPPAALMIALCRFAEWASGQGVGMEATIPFFQRFPFAVYSADWEIWFFAIFMLEGIGAWLIALALQSKKIPAAPGSRAKMFAVLFCSSQMFFEMLREDGFLRLQVFFLRLTQLGAMLVLVGVMLAALIKWARIPSKQRMRGGKMALLWLLFLACAGVNIWMQFAIQKSADLPVWACYAIMGLTCLGFGIISWKIIFHSREDA